MNAFCPATSIFIPRSAADYLADFPDRGDAFLVVAVHAQRVGPEFEGMAADRGDRALAAYLLDLGEHFLAAVHGARLAARQQPAVVVVAAVGKRLEPEFDAVLGGLGAV